MKCNSLITACLFCIATTCFAQNNLQNADSLYVLEDYKNSKVFRTKYLQQLAPTTTEYKQQKAKEWVTNFYLSTQTMADTLLLKKAMQLLQPINNIYNAETYVDAVVALANVYRGNDNENICLHYLKQLENNKNIAPYVSPNCKVLIYYTYASIYDNKAETYLLAIDYFNKAVQLAEMPSYTNKNALALLYNDMAIIYDYLGQKDKTINYYSKAQAIWWKQYKNWYISNNITALCNLIDAHSDYGTHQKATQYLDSLFQYFKYVQVATNNKTLWFRTPLQNTEAEFFIVLTAIRCYSAANNEKAMLSSMENLEKKINNAPAVIKEKYANYIIEGFTDVAIYYREKNNFAKAEYYFNKGGKITFDDFYAMKAAANMGILYNTFNKPNEALPNINTALEYFNATNNKRTTYFGLLATKAEILHKQKKYKQAIDVLDSLYKINNNQTITGTALQQFCLANFAKQINNTQITVLIKTGQVYEGLYQYNKQTKHLLTAHHFYKLAALLFKTYYTREFYSNYLFNLNQKITNGLLQTGLLLGNKANSTELLNIAENNASQHLWKKFTSKYSENLNVPDSLLNQRNTLLAELTLAEINKETADKLLALTSKLERINKSIQAINTSFAYFSNTNFNVASVQEKLKNNTTLIRFFSADSCVYAFTITNKNIQLQNIGSTVKIDNLINQISLQIGKPNNNYKQVATALYTQLINPTIAGTAAENIIFIPDGKLHFLSFDFLINAKTNQFLIQEKNIGYAHSLPLWQLQQIAKNNQHKIVAFAPSYPNLPVATALATRGNLTNLANAQKEAATIANLYKGSFFSNNAATTNNFINALGKYGIYHLAMHATIDKEQPENSNLLFFNNDKLYFKQLYQLNFPSAMVVLSACNTGIGAIENGEGVQSLSRALTYSGVQSAVYSLWEVPDKETSEIMIAFYKNLSKGQTKTLALANAKRSFLEKNPLKQHPFYWAGFVVNGNIQPISNGNNWWWYLLAFLVVGVLGFYCIKRKK